MYQFLYWKYVYFYWTFLQTLARSYNDGQQQFCQDCFRHFVRIRHHLGTTWAILCYFLDTTYALLGHYLGTIWAILRHCLDNTLAILGHHWAILGHLIVLACLLVSLYTAPACYILTLSGHTSWTNHSNCGLNHCLRWIDAIKCRLNMQIKILIIYALWLNSVNMVFHSAFIVFLPFWQPESLSWGRVPLIPH